MAHPGECPRAHRRRGRLWAAVAPMLLWVGVAAAALGGAAPALANPLEPVGPSPCPVQQQAPVGPPGVTGVPGVFGAVMTLWQQASTPVTAPPPAPAPGP